MRRPGIAALSVFALALSCHNPTPEPAPPDHQAAQRRIWSLVPAGAQGGVTVAELRHLLARLRALRAVASTGPIGNKYLTSWSEAARARIGFDPLDAAGWRKHGVDVSAPAAAFIADGQWHWVVRPTDAAAARALWALVGGACEDAGEWLVCGNLPHPGGGLAASVEKSLWPRVEKEGDPQAEVIAFAPLDGENLRAVLGLSAFTAASRSAFVGLTLGEEELRLVLRYQNPRSAGVQPFFALEPGVKSVLGAATGASGAARFVWSPHAVWSWAREQLGADVLDKASGALMMATGLDAEKDIIGNFTGELVVASYGGDSAGLGAQLFGARDEQKTRQLLERVDGMIAAVAAVPDVLGDKGIKLVRTVEQRQGRPVYTYKIDARAAAAGATLGAFEMTLGAAPGALILAFDRVSFDRAFAGLKKAPHQFLDGLEPPARRLFERAPPIAGWGTWTDFGAFMNRPEMQAAMKLYEALHPDLPGAMLELVGLAELIYDSTFVFDVGKEAMSLEYKVTLL